MFEAYTLLGALAGRTERVQLGTLVTGVTYRNPAILAKIVTTLDVISQGRAFRGIGAALFADDTAEGAEAKVDAFLAARGVDWGSLDEAGRALIGGRFIIGDRDAATTQLEALVDIGFDGFTVDLPADAADTTAVVRAGAILTDALA